MGSFFRSITSGFGSLATTIPGVISILCGSGTLLGLVPLPWTSIAMGICGIATGVGLIAAPDADKVQPKV